MNHPMETPAQARAVLKALRKARNLSQAQAGELLGVNQKRIAHIEAAPGRTGLAQVAKLVALLGGRLVVEETRAGNVEKKPAKATW